MGIKSCKIDDGFLEDKARRVNEAMEIIGAPFYQVCSSLKCKRDGKVLKRISWRRHGDSCIAGYINARYVNEKDIAKYLIKNCAGASLNQLLKSPLEYARSIEKRVKNVIAKKEEKAVTVRAKKEKPAAIPFAKWRKFGFDENGALPYGPIGGEIMINGDGYAKRDGFIAYPAKHTREYSTKYFNTLQQAKNYIDTWSKKWGKMENTINNNKKFIDGDKIEMKKETPRIKGGSGHPQIFKDGKKKETPRIKGGSGHPQVFKDAPKKSGLTEKEKLALEAKEDMKAIRNIFS